MAANVAQAGASSVSASVSAGTFEAGRGALILVLGLLSLLMLGPFTGIPAWVMGARDLRKIAEGKIAPSERTMTQVGMVLGIVGTVLGVLVIAIVLVTLLLVLGIVTSVSGDYSQETAAVLSSLPAAMLPGLFR
jgi:hypothetical protein